MTMATHRLLIGALFFLLCVIGHSSALFYPKTVSLKPGRCPRHLYGFPSRFHCDCDDDCIDDHKCCEYSCGMVCVPPAIVRLECPDTHGSVGSCVEECTCDNECGSGKKCCSNGCGHVCTTPITVKPGFCTPSINCLGASPCAEDGNCDGDKKCCHSLGCGMVYYRELQDLIQENILEAFPPKPGHCPTYYHGPESERSCKWDRDCHDDLKCCKYMNKAVCVPPIIVKEVCPDTTGMIGICVEMCMSDMSCPYGQKCCSNGCGHMCSNPIIVKPGDCPRHSLTQRCGRRCQHDGQCSGEMKCCQMSCGPTCRHPV
ncbi:hypothetical protein OJAV_G00063980 [Oryzias javanicus]|uniref:WAP domain-containing protein n=1 Tax=Oryzias javanicus TaxID=123683 RepID=A0A437D6W0_ORYJA|nr:hypothetical protein OJAV_G00063980 [Oryzias javanicus]